MAHYTSIEHHYQKYILLYLSNFSSTVYFLFWGYLYKKANIFTALRSF